MPTDFAGNPTGLAATYLITPLGILSSTNASPIVVQFSSPHGMLDGDCVEIEAHAVNTNANGVWTVGLIDASHVALIGSTGNGVGGATGIGSPLNLSPQFQIPSDGDQRNAASVNPGFETLADRSIFSLRSSGVYSLVQYQNGATEDTTFASWSHTATVLGEGNVQNGALWTSSGATGPFYRGFDIVEIEFNGTATATAQMSVGIHAKVSGGVAIRQGSLKQLNAGTWPLALRFLFPFTVPGTGQTLTDIRLVLVGTGGGQSMDLIGSRDFSLKQWRLRGQ